LHSAIGKRTTRRGMAEVISPWRYRGSPPGILRRESFEGDQPNSSGTQPWCYTHESLSLFDPLSSPPLSPEGAPLAEYASFLPMMDNFKLEDDVLTVQQSNKRPARGAVEIAPVPLERRTSEELASLVQDAFNDMDETLASRRPPLARRLERPSDTASAELPEAPIPSSMSWASDLGSMPGSESGWSHSAGGVGWQSERPSATPTQEEQAWLDAQIAEAAMDESGAMSGEEAEYVAMMLRMHPNLNQDEARWLFHRQMSNNQLESG